MSHRLKFCDKYGPSHQGRLNPEKSICGGAYAQLKDWNMRENPHSWPVIAPFIQPRCVAAGDIDEFGHVNNIKYIAWSLEIAWAHSNFLGLSFGDYQRLGVGCVVWRHEFDYLAAAREGEEILIATWIAHNDNRIRLTRAYEMRRAADDVILFRGQTLFVSVDMANGKPARMPKEFIEGYRPAEKETGNAVI